jgi:hypothetical protein
VKHALAGVPKTAEHRARIARGQRERHLRRRLREAERLTPAEKTARVFALREQARLLEAEADAVKALIS